MQASPSLNSHKREELIEISTGGFGFGAATAAANIKNEKINHLMLAEINEVSSDHENSNKNISSFSGGAEEESKNLLIQPGSDFKSSSNDAQSPVTKILPAYPFLQQ